MTTRDDARPAPFFLGDHLAMDFLNTTAAPWGEPIEWLGSGADLVDWLERAGAVDEAVAARFRADTDAFGALDAVAEEARTLREWLRGFVQRHAGKALGAAAVSELGRLNRLLARDDSYRQIDAATESGSERAQDRSQTLRWRQERRWTGPERLLQPIAEAIGDLVCHADFQHVRQCEGATCTLMFYDRSKSHARRWCSMTVCGNRAKAAAHRAKHRASSSATRRPRVRPRSTR